MSGKALMVFFALAIALEPAHADRCETLAANLCAAPPNGPGGQFIDETGYTYQYNKTREIVRLLDSHANVIKEKAASYVDALEKQNAFKKIFPYLPSSVRATCTKTPARCRETLESQVVELLRFDLSGGAVSKRFDINELGLLNAEDDDYGRTRSEAQDAIVKDSDSNMTKKLNDEVFPLLAEHIARVVASLIPDSPSRQMILAKLAGVHYGGDACLPLLFGSANLPSIAHIGAFYDPDNNSVRICRGFFGANTSLYPLYNTVAHEMTHSIDPCALMQANPDQPKVKTLRSRDELSPWANVIACLRDTKSTGARNLASNLDADSCAADQVTEAFADFVATEVMGQLIEEGTLGPKERTPQAMEAGIANIWRYTCRAPTLGKDDPHPSPQLRIDRLTAVHPVIRSALGCSPLPKNRVYCGNHEQSAMPASTPRNKKH